MEWIRKGMGMGGGEMRDSRLLSVSVQRTYGTNNHPPHPPSLLMSVLLSAFHLSVLTAGPFDLKNFPKRDNLFSFRSVDERQRDENLISYPPWQSCWSLFHDQK
jgi:hypothetical protein